MHSVLQIFIVLLFLKMIVQFALEWINGQKVLASRGSVPEAFKSFIEQSTYDKSINYTLAKTHFSQFEIVYNALLLLGIIFSGILPQLFNYFRELFGTALWAEALNLLAMGLLLSIFSWPLEWYNQFRLEEKFGFNRTTYRLWIIDKLKGLLVGFILGAPLLCALLAFFKAFPETWWIWGFALFFIFQLVMVVVYPMWIMPLFNKFEDLPPGDLRKRLMNLGDRTGFHVQTIKVMDGSKRSTHSNAFFSGLGKFRRIVLFDTLVEQLEDEELEGVLAHEIGHYKRGHIPKMVLVSGIFSFLGFAALGWLAKAPWFYKAFGFAPDSGMVPALILFTLLSGLVTFWISPLMNILSRKHEYEADAFAADAIQKADPLIHALRKLHQKNLSNLTPHPIYSCVYYSHPTLIEREKALRLEVQ